MPSERPEDRSRASRPSGRSPERLLNSAELADALNVNMKTVQRWVRAGRITATVTTPGGQYRFALDDVLRQLGQPRRRPDSD